MSRINLGTFHGYDYGEGYGYFTVYFEYSSISWYNGTYTINGCKVSGSCSGGYTANTITVSGSGGVSGSFSSQTSFSFSGGSFTYNSTGTKAYGTVTLSRPTNLSSVPSGWGGWIDGWTYYKSFTVEIDGSSLDKTAATITLSDPTSVTKDSLTFSVTSDTNCKTWQYQIGSGNWTTFDSGTKTSTTLSLTNLIVNTSYAVKVRATKVSNGVLSTSTAKTATTLGPSELSESSYTVEVGESKTFTWTRYDNTYSHELWIELSGSSIYNERIAQEVIGNSATVTIPTTISNIMPTSTSVTGSIILYTYSGDALIGSNSKPITVNIPSSYVPTVNVIATPVNTNSWLSSQGIYVNSFSKARIQTTATASIGTSIAGYLITGFDTDGTNADWTSNILNDEISDAYANHNYSVKVTDLRGRTKTISGSFRVYSYNTPVITSLSYERGVYENNIWTSDDSGSDLKVVYSTNHSSLNGNNTLNITAKLGSMTIDALTDSDDVIDRVVYKTNIGTVDAYELAVNAVDKIGKSTTKKISIPPTNIPFVLDFNRNSVGIGGVPQSTNVFEIWNKTLFENEAVLKDALSWTGTALQSTDNLDDLVNKGKYYCNNERQFGSAGSSNNFALYVLTPTSSSSNLIQFVMGKNGDIFIRSGVKYTDSTSWNEWKNIIGDVTKAYVDAQDTATLNSANSYTDTSISTIESRDYIVAQGTSNNWTYRKWNSGFCELWHNRLSIPINAGSAVSSNVVVNFPFNVTNPIVSFGLSQNTSSAGNAGIIDIANLTTTQIVLRSHRNSATNDSWAVEPRTFINVVGAWK